MLFLGVFISIAHNIKNKKKNLFMFEDILNAPAFLQTLSIKILPSLHIIKMTIFQMLLAFANTQFANMS
jgi:hypothetical protein